MSSLGGRFLLGGRALLLSTTSTTTKRPFMTWLNRIFNQVDSSRIAEVGADRAAAEWLLRCGAAVRWKTSKKPLTSYNDLPVGDYRQETKKL